MRRLLIALLFSLTAWATVARFTPAGADAANAVTADVCSEAEAGGAGGTTDSDSRWVAAHRAIVSVTESRWKSPGGHATFVAAPARNALAETFRIGATHRRSPARSAHLLHTPLLI